MFLGLGFEISVIGFWAWGFEVPKLVSKDITIGTYGGSLAIFRVWGPRATD